MQKRGRVRQNQTPKRSPEHEIVLDIEIVQSPGARIGIAEAVECCSPVAIVVPALSLSRAIVAVVCRRGAALPDEWYNHQCNRIVGGCGRSELFDGGRSWRAELQRKLWLWARGFR